MNCLPYEILREIFTLIPQHQKVECMCVCRSWEKVIKDTRLFHTVLITHTNRDKLIRILKRTPSNTTQVKRLLLYNPYGCSRSDLINAPNLVHLTLTQYQFKYNVMEQLDQIYPLLETVKFELIHPPDIIVPNNIKPNNRITCVEFKLKNISMVDQATLLGYIRKKYTNLISFAYDSGVPEFSVSVKLYGDISFTCEIHRALISLIVSQGSQLKRLKVLCTRFMFFQLTNSVMPFQLDELNLDLTIACLKNLPIRSTFLESPFRQLRALTIQFLSYNNFEWLEVLNKLEVLKIKYPRFRLLRIDSVMQYTSNTLETLVIKGCSVEVTRSYHVLSPLEASKLDQDNITNMTNHMYSLRKIKMTNVKIKENVDKFISLSCPGLKILSMYNCSIDNLEFRLPNTNLLHFNIAIQIPRYVYTDNESEHRDYIWVHTKEESRLWCVNNFQYMRPGLKYFDFYGFPDLPCPIHNPDDTLVDKSTCSFTFASFKYIGAIK